MKYPRINKKELSPAMRKFFDNFYKVIWGQINHDNGENNLMLTDKDVHLLAWNCAVVVTASKEKEVEEELARRLPPEIHVDGIRYSLVIMFGSVAVVVLYRDAEGKILYRKAADSEGKARRLMFEKLTWTDLYNEAAMDCMVCRRHGTFRQVRRSLSPQ